MDANTIDTLMRVCSVLVTFYSLKTDTGGEMDFQYIEDSATTKEVTNFIKAQLNVMEEHDFLLKPLSGIITMLDITTEQLIQMVSRNSESMQNSVNSGDVR